MRFICLSITFAHPKLTTMKNLKLFIVFVLTISIGVSCSTKQEKMEKRLREFLTAYDAKVIPLYKESALTSWNANITGNDADLAISEKAAFEFDKYYTDKDAFAELKEIKESNAVKDSLLLRQLDLIYDSYLGKQVDTSLIATRLAMKKNYQTIRWKMCSETRLQTLNFRQHGKPTNSSGRWL